ncbi:helix-turn-helix domain-containing protein [Populibacterium corticicola]|uniref:Helix-turn-helix domain-containing protein n=1 Tax=Populibacterium corticicola TaxID=1812826 RepID=A0ABW5XC97_9MICO
MSQTAQHSELLSVVKVAEILGCSKSHVYRLIADRQLPSLNIGLGTRAKTRIPRVNVEKYIDERLTTPTKK